MTDTLVTRIFRKSARSGGDAGTQHLREREEHFRLALEAAQIGSWEWDAQSGLLEADAVHQSLFGWPPQDHAQPVELYYDRMVPEEVAQANKSAEAALREGKPFQYEQRVLRSDGRVVWLSSRGTRKKHDPNRMIGVSFDITERKRAEEALRETKARLQAAVDLVGLSLYSWDLLTGALEWDAGLKKMWGLSPDTEVNTDLFIAGIHSDDRARVLSAIAHCVDPDGDGIYNIEYRVVALNDGVERWVSTYGKTEFVNRRPVRFIGAALDITNRKRADEELRSLTLNLEQRVVARSNELAAANERLRHLQAEMFHAARLSAAGHMAAAIAHELIQPLTVIDLSIGAADRLLAKNPADLGTAHDLLEQAKAQSKRLGDILRRTRGFIDRRETRKRRADLPALIHEAKSLVLSDFQPNPIEVVYRLDPGASHVFADAIQIEQVLVNLIRNAVDAMASTPRPRLTLATARIDRRTVAVGVGDNGSGLPEGLADHIFDPFVSTKPQGMGLGLWLCRAIAEGNGGQIWCHSRPNEGALFFFSLPARAPQRS